MKRCEIYNVTSMEQQIKKSKNSNNNHNPKNDEDTDGNNNKKENNKNDEGGNLVSAYLLPGFKQVMAMIHDGHGSYTKDKDNDNFSVEYNVVCLHANVDDKSTESNDIKLIKSNDVESIGINY